MPLKGSVRLITSVVLRWGKGLVNWVHAVCMYIHSTKFGLFIPLLICMLLARRWGSITIVLRYFSGGIQLIILFGLPFVLLLMCFLLVLLLIFIKACCTSCCEICCSRCGKLIWPSSYPVCINYIPCAPYTCTLLGFLSLRRWRHSLVALPTAVVLVAPPDSNVVGGRPGHLCWESEGVWGWLSSEARFVIICRLMVCVCVCIWHSYPPWTLCVCMCVVFMMLHPPSRFDHPKNCGCTCIITLYISVPSLVS